MNVSSIHVHWVWNHLWITRLVGPICRWIFQSPDRGASLGPEMDIQESLLHWSFWGPEMCRIIAPHEKVPRATSWRSLVNPCPEQQSSGQMTAKVGLLALAGRRSLGIRRQDRILGLGDIMESLKEVHLWGGDKNLTAAGKGSREIF